MPKEVSQRQAADHKEPAGSHFPGPGHSCPQSTVPNVIDLLQSPHFEGVPRAGAPRVTLTPLLMALGTWHCVSP